jgi:hypothetical protein
MNNPDQPRETNDPLGIITSTEQLVASLWKTEKDEVPPIAPPGSEAVEDEIAKITCFIKDFIAEHDKHATDHDLVILSQHCHGSIVVYVAEIVRYYLCGNCDKVHHEPKEILIIKDGNGIMAAPKPEMIMDRRDELVKKLEAEREANGTLVIRIDLSDFIGGTVDKIMQRMAEQAGKGRGDDEDEDELPPATGPRQAMLDEELLRKLKERRGPGSAHEDPDPPEITARLPVIPDTAPQPWANEEIHRDNTARPGWLRRVWDWLWR